jgi:hypothetical protein
MLDAGTREHGEVHVPDVVDSVEAVGARECLIYWEKDRDVGERAA